MERKVSFYGTPLNKSSNDDQVDDDGPIQNRRARLNYQQTVRDSQGRQRFHGAFTGGFSAGYFNTVDSVAGFQPRQFISRRGAKHDTSTSKFSHKPEDYMDEEDFGEFGIAPKKIRVIGNYSSNEQPQQSNFGHDLDMSRIIKPNSLSIGESILRQLNRGSISNRYQVGNQVPLRTENLSNKNNYHGLGYKPLKSREMSSTCVDNPLTAVLEGGKRLKISGEAFGSGVIEDEEELMDAGAGLEYDFIGDYKLRYNQHPRFKSQVKADLSSSEERTRKDEHLDLPGFNLAKNLKAMQISNDICNYPNPTIPKEWVMPTRTKPYIPPSVANARSMTGLQRSSTQFNRKFVQSSSSKALDDIETKAGLVRYSDLRATESKTSITTQFTTIERETPTISRQKLEWRPCSLLCKRFNVPNPYPDNLFTGVKVPNLIEDCDKKDASIEQPKVINRHELLELKRSIFNVKFVDREEINCCMVDDSGSDDGPQVLELPQSESTPYSSDHDILEVSTARREPEVIVLSSSSSSPHTPGQVEILKETGVDIYGPPLPPRLRYPMDLDRPSLRSRSSKKKKKSKKHKRSHRHSSKDL